MSRKTKINGVYSFSDGNARRPNLAIADILFLTFLVAFAATWSPDAFLTVGPRLLVTVGFVGYFLMFFVVERHTLWALLRRRWRNRRKGGGRRA